MRDKIKKGLVIICICIITCSCNITESDVSTADNMHFIEKNNSMNISNEFELDEQTSYVYITDTGKKYHRELCISLKYSKRKCTLEEAEKLGLTECKICKPISYK